jgi:dimeric dUTPase (all-alpha-NTP-PPase superfamily)
MTTQDVHLNTVGNVGVKLHIHFFNCYHFLLEIYFYETISDFLLGKNFPPNTTYIFLILPHKKQRVFVY